MANHYFLFQKRPEINSIFTILDRTAAHHIFDVMRMQEGSKLEAVFDDAQAGLLEIVNSVNHTVKLLDNLTVKTELPIKVTIVVGFPKGDKLDFIVEKATELGATAIWAAPFDYSVVKWDATKRVKKQEKLSKIALSAAEQSKRLILPEIKFFDKLTDLTASFTAFDAVLTAYEESAKQGEHQLFQQALSQHPKNLLLIFGPEGGISPAEIQQFTQAGAHLTGLGPRILRAETAPLYALAAISAYLELFSS